MCSQRSVCQPLAVRVLMGVTGLMTGVPCSAEWVGAFWDDVKDLSYSQIFSLLIPETPWLLSCLVSYRI